MKCTVYCKRHGFPSEYGWEFDNIRDARQYVAWLISAGWDEAWVVNRHKS